MSELLGTKAPIASDLNLLLQITILVILLVGFKLGKEKTQSSLKTHGRVMTIMVLLNAMAILLVMGPSFVINFGLVLGEVSTMGFPLTLVHALFGGTAEILGIIFMLKKFGNVRMWMRFTWVLWLIALALGIVFYVQYYIVQPV